MRAALLREVDGPFEIREVPEPAADGKALVRVRAAGINFADVLVRRGRYPQMPELPAVLGSEIAGELEDGSRVMAFTSGGGGYAELAAVDPGVVATAVGELLALWERQAFRPLVGAELPLDDVERAHELLESRRSVGKVVLVP